MNGDGLGCGCAACRGGATPATTANRPGLSQVSYRSGRHGDFLSAMLDALPSPKPDAVPPPPQAALSRLRTRDADDPTIALLDAFAVTCDVLTFYTERLANEAFLATATERISLQELGALVAYRLGRGVAAQATLAFTVERPPLLPPREGMDPGVLPPDVPQRVLLPRGLRVQSVPGPGEKPQTFETAEDVLARPEWNALPLVRTVPYEPEGSVEAWLAGVALRLSPGDTVLFTMRDRADLRVLSAADAGASRTHIAWTQGLDFSHDAPVTDPDPGARVFRKHLSVFGHNAAQWRALSVDFRLDYANVTLPADLPGEWPGFTAVDVTRDGIMVDVEGSQPDIAPGSLVVVAWQGKRPDWRVYEVAGRSERSRSEFAVSGRVTRLSLVGPNDIDFGSPRDVIVYAVADMLDLAEVPDTSPVEDSTIFVEGDAAEMAPGRRILLVGTSAGRPAAEVLEVEKAGAAGKRTRLTLTATPSRPFDRATAVVFGNAAHATHGATVGQLLGSGDARVPFAAVTLAQQPLTFVPAPTPRGTASTLEVRIDDVAWSEVATTAIAGERDRVFMTRDEPDGGVSVVFGDGVRGVRPPTGVNNIRASYRIGVGTAGNVPADALSMPLDRPLGLKAVTNPIPAEGGVDPEAESSARRSIPIPVRTLGRAVSLRDYADFALAFTGIGMAEAAIVHGRGGPVVAVSVADAAGLAPPPTTLARLDAELSRFGDPSSRHVVIPCRSVRFHLGLGVKVEPARRPEDVLPAVETELRARYSASAVGIGRAVHASAVTAVAASVPGVVAVDLDRLYATGLPALRSRLVPRSALPRQGLVRGAEILSLSPAPFDVLEVRE